MLIDIDRGTRFDAARDRWLSGLESADRRLAHEIAAGVLRNRTRLDGIVRPLLRHPWERTRRELRHVLRIGAYQLTMLDRVPRYAAVDSTVELARLSLGGKSPSLVNAVLRKVRRPENDPPTDPSGFAEFYSHPEWLVRRWIERFGVRDTRRLLERNNTPRPLVLQPVDTDSETLAADLRSAGIRVVEVLDRDGVEIGSTDPTTLPGYSEGRFLIQDSTQSRLLNHADLPSGLVWDCCAAPGGKSVALARDPRRRVTASDINLSRLRILTDNLSRTASDALVLLCDAGYPAFGPATFDGILVDAPCSGTGVMARNPDARWHLTPQHIERATRIQDRILDAVADLVRPGGTLAYVTCSLEREENEARVDRFLAADPRFERISPDMYIFPPDVPGDGGFGARLTRSR